MKNILKRKVLLMREEDLLKIIRASYRSGEIGFPIDNIIKLYKKGLKGSYISIDKLIR